jgi:hypothetical protein
MGKVERGSAPFVRIADKNHRSRIVPVAVPLHRASFFVAVDYTTSLFVCFAMAFITAFTNTGSWFAEVNEPDSVCLLLQWGVGGFQSMKETGNIDSHP